MALQRDLFGKIPGYKKCSCCHKFKECRDFNVNKTSFDGLQSYCKECQHFYYLRHPQKEYKRNKRDDSLTLF